MPRLTVICMSSDRTSHLVPGFVHQWRKYCHHPVTVVCQSNQPVIPISWSLFNAGVDEPGYNWAGQLSQAVRQHVNIGEFALLVMDDYWLCEPVNQSALTAAWTLMEHAAVDKIDLSGDRNGFAHTPHWDEHYIKSDEDAEYLTSTQAAIWKQGFLLHCIQNDGWSPWQFELDGTKIIQGKTVEILGLKTPCIQYANVSLRGQKELRLDRLKQADIDELRAIGAI